MLSEKLDIAYMRLSLEDNDVTSGDTSESCSISSQRLCIKEFARANADVPDALTEYIDDGYTGTNMERPAMSRILQMVTMGRVRTIVVRDLSRFARNYLEAGHYLEFIFPAYDVRFISINDHYDSSKVGYEDQSALQLAIRNLLNDLYSKDISRKIKSAVDVKKMSGEYVYGQVPYGYKKGAVKNTIVIDEPAAEVVRRIFFLAEHGNTITQIARMLNEKGVMTPSVYLASVRGKYKVRDFWTYESIRNILENRIYTGDTIPFKSHVVRVGSKRVKMLSEEEQIIIPNTHEAIISRETYYKAKNVVKSNVKTKTGRASSALSGYLVCGCCGNKLSKGRPTNRNWLCPSARYVTECECSSIRLNEATMKEKLLSAIQMQCDLADAKVKAVKVKQDSIFSQMKQLEMELKQRKKQVDENSGKLMKMLEEYYDGGYTKDEFLQAKEGLKRKEEQLKEASRSLEAKLLTLKEEAGKEQNMFLEADTVKKHSGITELDSYLMKELVKEIRVFPNNAVQITWNFAQN